jgi:hypothetical protein
MAGACREGARAPGLIGALRLDQNRVPGRKPVESGTSARQSRATVRHGQSKGAERWPARDPVDG